MILGGSKKEVILNIQNNVLNNKLNDKVETDDPNLSDEEINKALDKFYISKKKVSYIFKNQIARKIVKKFSCEVTSIEVEGLENIKDLDLSGGAIITSNHFNPFDSYNSRKIVEDILKRKLYIIIQDTNLAMKGNLGFLMNNLDVLPITKSPSYLNKKFIPELENVLKKGNIVLIYPEEEMWFNYRKPRPCKRGAYQFAYQFNVPIISCFVEMIDTDIIDNDEFYKVKYIVHILKPIIPNKSLTMRSSSISMANTDYEQKKEAYEKAYHKSLDYNFDYTDIAGFYNKD